jgi:hypothetical protein
LNQYEEQGSSPESTELSNDIDNIQVEEDSESVSSDETLMPKVDGKNLMRILNWMTMQVSGRRYQ